jgi:hypothetical protein
MDNVNMKDLLILSQEKNGLGDERQQSRQKKEPPKKTTLDSITVLA